jgi:hypothetical protein
MEKELQSSFWRAVNRPLSQGMLNLLSACRWKERLVVQFHCLPADSYICANLQLFIESTSTHEIALHARREAERMEI